MIGGHYPLALDECVIPIAPLAQRARAEFVQPPQQASMPH